jgi:hypothetical protein
MVKSTRKKAAATRRREAKSHVDFTAPASTHAREALAELERLRKEYAAGKAADERRIKAFLVERTFLLAVIMSSGYRTFGPVQDRIDRLLRADARIRVDGLVDVGSANGEPGTVTVSDFADRRRDSAN